eukprot:9234-Eustigmatos_ZCMA.PRE.1
MGADVCTCTEARSLHRQGAERRVIFDFVHVLQGDCTLQQALIRDKRCDNLFLLAASQTKDKDVLTTEGVGKM